MSRAGTPHKKAPETEVNFTYGQATWKLAALDRGFGGPYGCDRLPAEWECVDCHRIINGTNESPWVNDTTYTRNCANGHAPCRLCGEILPRLTCGCPREHKWNRCPGKTEDDKMLQQHADRGHNARPEVHA